MADQLVPASIEDKTWLERLRRAFTKSCLKLLLAAGGEARHARQFRECWERGGISIIKVDGERVGMIQLFDQPDAVEVGEIQIEPRHQNEGIGSRVLQETVARAHKQRKRVLLFCGFQERPSIAALSAPGLSEGRADLSFVSIRVIDNARNEVRNEEGCGAINPCCGDMAKAERRGVFHFIERVL
jgi:GNAT superfamily N-acetyltransferase